jgi:uncharacterized membrane protein (UPF0127 family)
MRRSNRSPESEESLSQRTHLRLVWDDGRSTCFMRFAIDVVFLDRQLWVLGVSPGVRPWPLSARRGARVVLELAASESERRGLRADDRLRFAERLGRSA